MVKERITKNKVNKLIRGQNKWVRLSLKCIKCGYIYYVRTETPELFEKFNPIKRGKIVKKKTRYTCLLCKMFKDYNWYRCEEE